MVLVKLFFIYKNGFSRLAFRECPYGRVERPTLDKFSYVRDDDEEDLKTQPWLRRARLYLAVARWRTLPINITAV